jgi:hypothetical protein
VRLTVGRVGLQALLHRAQVEEELALGLGGGDLDHAPVPEDVLVDLGLDPVQRVADQAHALLGVEALDGLHQADVAFLDAGRPAAARSPGTGARPRPPGAGATAPASGGFQVTLLAQAPGEIAFSWGVSIGSRFTALM